MNYSAICSKFILPLSDKLSYNKVMHYYNLYNKMQWMDRKDLLKLQNKSLIETVCISQKEVPFYKALYDKHKIDLSEINTVNDLPKLPIVTKDDLRKVYPSGCTRLTRFPFKEYSTSGSSGRPFSVRVDNDTMSRARALMLMRANYSGWQIGDPHFQTGMTLERGIVKKLKDIALRVQYVSAFDLSDQILDLYLDIIDRKKLKYIMGYAASLYCLAERAEFKRINLKLKGIVTWGDNLYQHYRKKIEGAFKCKVTDTYGCGEGIQIAAQCSLSGGAYHIFMPHVIVEIVDKEGMPVSPGEMGDIILTRLDPGAMPLIRYKVGDIGIKGSEASCDCGRGFELLTKIEGRDTDLVLTPSGNRLIVHFFTGIFEYYNTIDTFKIVQDKTDHIDVFIVPRSDFKMEHWEKLKAEIQEKGDPELKMDVTLVDEIPTEQSNKRRFVVSKIVGK